MESWFQWRRPTQGRVPRWWSQRGLTLELETRVRLCFARRRGQASRIEAAKGTEISFSQLALNRSKSEESYHNRTSFATDIHQGHHGSHSL